MSIVYFKSFGTDTNRIAYFFNEIHVSLCQMVSSGP